MKRLFLLCLVLVLTLMLAGCPFQSNNTASDDDTRTWSKTSKILSENKVLSENTVKLVEVQVDNRTWINVESPCPLAVQMGNNSCNVQVTK